VEASSNLAVSSLRARHRIPPQKRHGKKPLHAPSPANPSQTFQRSIQGFAAKGIPESEIKPRENVFTFNAWKALGSSRAPWRAWRQGYDVH